MKTLGEVASFLSGGTPKKSIPTYWDGDISWYSASNMNMRFLSDAEPRITEQGLAAGSKLAPQGATLLLVRGSGLFNYIPICFADQNVAFNQDVKAICAKPKTDPMFLHFWIESLRPILRGNIGVTGIGAGKFDLDFLKALPFPEIGETEQNKIGILASSFDRKIEMNRWMNATLEAMARALFRDWFVDFGPTRAKMAGSPPYLAPEIWSLFPDRLDDDGVPEGWEEEPLSEFFSILGGGTPKTKEPDYWGGDILWYSVVDAPDGSGVYVLDTEKKITQRGVEESSAKLVREGTTIISARGTVGKLAMAAQDMTFNQSCYGLQGAGEVGDCFTYLAAQHMVSRLQAMAHGSVFSTITRATFDSLLLPKPSGEIFSAFDAAVSPHFAKMKANGNETRTLAQTRDLLLPKLMSGEIRVREAEAIVEAAR